MPQDHTAQNILDRLSDIENHPYEGIVPYQEFNVGGKLYYFTPGGLLCRRGPGTDEAPCSKGFVLSTSSYSEQRSYPRF